MSGPDGGDWRDAQPPIPAELAWITHRLPIIVPVVEGFTHDRRKQDAAFALGTPYYYCNRWWVQYQPVPLRRFKCTTRVTEARFVRPVGKTQHPASTWDPPYWLLDSQGLRLRTEMKGNKRRVKSDE